MKELNELQKNLLIKAIDNEIKNQYQKWGDKKHTIEKWFVILSEEFGEIAKSINEFYNNLDDGHEKYQKEIIQTMAILTHLYFKPHDISFEYQGTNIKQ